MYKITRFFANGDREEIQDGLTLEEAKEHCSDPDTSSRTCTTDEGMELTAKRGPWFDGYDEE
jgi:hypothetical protein